MYSLETINRFFRQCDTIPTNRGCWIWRGATGGPGKYGQISINNRKRYAHVVAYELRYGQIPEGLEIDHICATHLCVNPIHLHAVTHAENMRRHFAKKTHCKKGHALTEDNVYRNSNYPNNRKCRTCQLDNMKRYQSNKRIKALV